MNTATISMTTKPGGMTVERLVHDDFTSIIFRFEDNTGAIVQINVHEFDNDTNSPTSYPRIREKSAYVVSDAGDNNDIRARYPVFIPQMTDIDRWEAEHGWVA
tara:strand:- start:2618 stop:2926 length:309 start_codon:yes stop_codon:yes gene_type:complete